jgi:branched-chain amino acid transport system substrate-binding protein
MGRVRRIAVCLGVFLLAACGSRVVPLEINAGGTGGITAGTGTGTAGTGTAGTGTAGTGTAGTGFTTGTTSGPLADCHAPATPTDTGVSKDTIKIGLVAAINGAFRGQFDANWQAVDAYFKMINAEEGGICGRKLQLYIRDDQGNAQQDLTAARELAEDVGIFAFVGSISAPDSDTGVSRVSHDHKIPDVGFPLTYERSSNRYTFGVPGQVTKDVTGEGQSGTRYLNSLYKIKQVAVLWVGEALVSKANAWVFEASALKNSGEPPTIKVCYERETSVLDTNFDSYAIAISQHCPVSGGPLAVYTTMENNSNIKLAQSMKGQDVKYAYFSPTFTSYLPSFVRDDTGHARTETEGAYIAVPQIPFERCSGPDSKGRPVPPCSHPELSRYVTALARYVPNFKAPGSWGGPGWGEAALFVEAAKLCGAQLTRTCVLQKLNTIKNFSANGFVSPTTPSDHLIYSSDLILQVRNGRFVEIRPTDKSGPSEAPDFWDVSKLYNWWDYFCEGNKKHKQYFGDSRDDIDAYVTKC